VNERTSVNGNQNDKPDRLCARRSTQFNVPELRVGAFDDLIELGDTISEVVSPLLDAVARRIQKQFVELHSSDGMDEVSISQTPKWETTRHFFQAGTHCWWDSSRSILDEFWMGWSEKSHAQTDQKNRSRVARKRRDHRRRVESENQRIRSCQGSAQRNFKEDRWELSDERPRRYSSGIGREFLLLLHVLTLTLTTPIYLLSTPDNVGTCKSVHKNSLSPATCR